MNEVEEKILSIFQTRLKEPRITKYTNKEFPDIIIEFENNEKNLSEAGLELIAISLNDIYKFQKLISITGESKKITHYIETPSESLKLSCINF